MHGDEGLVDVADLHAQQQLTAEVEACRWADDSTLVACEERLVALRVVARRRAIHVLRQRRLAHAVEHLAEGLLVAIVEEAQRTAA